MKHTLLVLLNSTRTKLNNHSKGRTFGNKLASTTTNPYTTSTKLATINTTPRKEYTINQQTPFTGDRTKIENFLQECDVYLNVNDAIYDTEPVKIAFVLSFITAGEAQKWKEQFIALSQATTR